MNWYAVCRSFYAIVWLQIFILAGCFALCATSWGAQVGPGAFSGGALVEDYEGLALPFTNGTPILIGGDTYSTDDNTLRYDAAFGSFLGRSGFAIGNNTDAGYIDIKLAQPVLRAGLYVGVDDQWSADVSFYNVADTLLGTISAAAPGLQNVFAGWQADVGLVARIRVEDTSFNNRIILVDDLVREVPEPATGPLVIAALLAAICAGRFKRNTLVASLCLRSALR